MYIASTGVIHPMFKQQDRWKFMSDLADITDSLHELGEDLYLQDSLLILLTEREIEPF
jgi:hypothetical protein